MIVRLKAYPRRNSKSCLFRFNSMIVRLKVFVVAGGVNKIPPFQFYDSPIKRLENAEQAARIVSFNSMIVRLKESGV